MKHFPLAICMALLCALNVNALPSIAEPHGFLREFVQGQSDALDVAAQYECFVDALQTASEAANLKRLWQSYERHFRKNIEIWSQCGDIQTAKGLICHSSQAALALILTTNYLSAAAEQNTLFYAVFLPQYIRTCIVPSNPLTNRDFVDSARDSFACRTETVSDAVATTDFELHWLEYVGNMEDSLRGIESCSDTVDPIQTGMCVAAHAAALLELEADFLTAVREENLELFAGIAKRLLEHCR